MSEPADLPDQLEAVGAFLAEAPLAQTVADLEMALAGCEAHAAAEVAAARGITVDLLRAAIAARETLGKVSDLIHAAAIALALPHILEPGETLVRPSLAAGNTKDRLFDVETDRRIAEFKLARWTGADGARQKSAVKVVMAWRPPRADENERSLRGRWPSSRLFLVPVSPFKVWRGSLARNPGLVPVSPPFRFDCSRGSWPATIVTVVRSRRSRWTSSLSAPARSMSTRPA